VAVWPAGQEFRRGACHLSAGENQGSETAGVRGFSRSTSGSRSPASWPRRRACAASRSSWGVRRRRSAARSVAIAVRTAATGPITRSALVTLTRPAWRWRRRRRIMGAGEPLGDRHARGAHHSLRGPAAVLTDGMATADEVREAIIGALESVPVGLRRTLTWDQGKGVRAAPTDHR
jgi:hypothetical protein